MKYKIYAAAVALWMIHGVFFGWSRADVDEVPHVPKSVRENPGSYRSHYASRARYTGGR